MGDDNLSISDFSQTSKDTIEKTFREYEVMLRFALAEGRDMDAATQERIAFPEALQPSSAQFKFARLLAAHAALTKIVAPATPRSLEATEPQAGLWGSLSRPPLVKLMIIIAVIALVGFVTTSVFLPKVAVNPAVESR